MRDFGVAAVRGENAPRLRLLSRFFIITALALVTCAPQVWAGSCRKSGEWCSQGAGTRTINGVPVYRDCWEYTDTFECVDDASVDYCAAIAATPECNITSSYCSNGAFNGECLTYTKNYACGTE